VKVTTNPKPLYDHATTAFYDAAGDTLKLAQQIAPKRSGKYASTLKLYRRQRKDRPTATIGSRTAPQTSVLERGGWVRSGRGVHIARANAPKPLTRAGEQFPKFYERRLRRAPIRSSSFVAHSFGGERGTPTLLLGGE
jgi:hypothetical protein